MRVLEVVVDGGGSVLAHVPVGGDGTLHRRRQGGDLGEDFGAEARLFDDLFCICSICGREKQAEILGLCINFSLHPWVNSKNRVDVQGVERYTYIEK